MEGGAFFMSSQRSTYHPTSTTTSVDDFSTDISPHIETTRSRPKRHRKKPIPAVIDMNVMVHFDFECHEPDDLLKTMKSLLLASWLLCDDEYEINMIVYLDVKTRSKRVSNARSSMIMTSLMNNMDKYCGEKVPTILSTQNDESDYVNDTVKGMLTLYTMDTWLITSEVDDDDDDSNNHKRKKNTPHPWEKLVENYQYNIASTTAMWTNVPDTEITLRTPSYKKSDDVQLICFFAGTVFTPLEFKRLYDQSEEWDGIYVFPCIYIDRDEYMNNGNPTTLAHYTSISKKHDGDISTKPMHTSDDNVEVDAKTTLHMASVWFNGLCYGLTFTWNTIRNVFIYLLYQQIAIAGCLCYLQPNTFYCGEMQSITPKSISDAFVNMNPNENVDKKQLSEQCYYKFPIMGEKITVRASNPTHFKFHDATTESYIFFKFNRFMSNQIYRITMGLSVSWTSTIYFFMFYWHWFMIYHKDEYSFDLLIEKLQSQEKLIWIGVIGYHLLVMLFGYGITRYTKIMVKDGPRWTYLIWACKMFVFDPLGAIVCPFTVGPLCVILFIYRNILHNGSLLRFFRPWQQCKRFNWCCCTRKNVSGPSKSNHRRYQNNAFSDRDIVDLFG